MRDQLNAGTPLLQLRADPAALAPERLLVFELTGSVLKFEEAVRLVPGLEFLGAEDLDEDEFDKDPAMYLMVPSEAALRNIVTLWNDWRRTGQVPPYFTAWKTLLSQLRDIRPWGPQDRITPSDFLILEDEINSGKNIVRVEIELVFRRDEALAEGDTRGRVAAAGGRIISSKRIEGAGYHAMLADIPAAALRRALEQDPNGLAGSESVLQIRPQSIFHLSPSEEIGPLAPSPERAFNGDPIAAIFDAVPLSGHPRLAGALSVDDPFDLEPLSVGLRQHGTAMASAVIHGDLNRPWSRTLERPVYFVNMLYAPGGPNEAEQFPDRLPADLFESALVRMKSGPNPTAAHVILINASLGDSNKPFAGRMSGWARVVDYLSYRYGVLFVISAGNYDTPLQVQNTNVIAFEALSGAQKLRAALSASASQIATRRILAPAEAMNVVTVGAFHDDHHTPPNPLPASIFDVFAKSGLCTVSSGLGPGLGGAIKPDILAPGGQHHVRLGPAGAHVVLQPLKQNAGTFGGVAVASPPTSTSFTADIVARSVGTSVAAALVTGVSARAHEALEAAYPDFVGIPSTQRATLLKALLVHGAKWTEAQDLIAEVLGPHESTQHYKRKDNIRRYLGFGAYDPERLINCADDRATLWAVGTIEQDQGKRFRIPWPAAMSGKKQTHAVSATLAWFSPPKPGAVAYRAVKMKIIEPDQLGTAGVKAVGTQPDPKQAQKGTVVLRRWEGDKVAAIAGDGFFEIDVQREADGLEDTTAVFAIVVTLEMGGEAQIYTQVRDRVTIKPLVAVRS